MKCPDCGREVELDGRYDGELVVDCVERRRGMQAMCRWSIEAYKVPGLLKAARYFMSIFDENKGARND